MSYFDNTNFLEKYTQIMDITYLSKQLHKIKDIDNQNIFTPKIQNILQINKSINSIN